MLLLLCKLPGLLSAPLLILTTQVCTGITILQAYFLDFPQKAYAVQTATARVVMHMLGVCSSMTAVQHACASALMSRSSALHWAE